MNRDASGAQELLPTAVLTVFVVYRIGINFVQTLYLCDRGIPSKGNILLFSPPNVCIN